MQQGYIDDGDILFFNLQSNLWNYYSSSVGYKSIYSFFGLWGQWDGEQAILKILIKQNIALIIGQND